MTPGVATAALWAAWVLSWGLAAVWTRRTQARAAFGEILLYSIPTALGAWLLLFAVNASVAAGGGPLATRFASQLWRLPEWAGWVTTGVAAAGFAFTWWARVTLGDLWSGAVSRKENHVIVERGPYALVRHPIYTGLIGAAFAAAVEVGSAQALVGAALISFGFWLKARLEERFLMSELGEASYADYRRRTPMLAPFWRMGR
ncbi:MAG TPA: isoprenylcysteine carboxylmethyltransferase family protein [Caulobacteraceae bacterium]|nr:isoprenylcysteine carboxylmethyltransferase family protein [Caulobacteraceae bacterium]